MTEPADATKPPIPPPTRGGMSLGFAVIVSIPALLMLVALAWCEFGRDIMLASDDIPPPVTAPRPKADPSMRVPSESEACAIVTGEVGRSCPRIKSLDPASCNATEKPVATQHSDRGVYLLGPGAFVSFGLKFEWYVRHDRTVLANSDDAAKYCSSLQTVAAWLKPKLEEEAEAAKWCTKDNLAKARVIDLELAEANFEVEDAADIRRKETAAMKRAAKRLGITVKEADELYLSVSLRCGNQLRAARPCSSKDREIADALDDAVLAIDRRGLDGMGLLRARNEATRRVAKRFALGPAAAEQAAERCM